MVHVRTDKQSGGILIAVVGAVMIISLVALAKTAMMDIERKLKNQVGGNTVLTRLDLELANFVAQNRRLPCPTIGTTPGGAAGAGLEQRIATTGACNPATQISGVVPWATLGLPEEATLDAWGNRITYRVDPALTAQFAPIPAPGPYFAMDMTNCTTGIGTAAVTASVSPPSATTYPQCNSMPCSGVACTGQDNVFAGKGLDIWNGILPYALPNRLNTRGTNSGAAYILISHGPNAAGAYNTAGALLPGTGAVGANETPNLNGQALALPQTQATAFRNAQFNSTQTAQHFDDLVSHPTILSVLQKAHLAPRQ